RLDLMTDEGKDVGGESGGALIRDRRSMRSDGYFDDEVSSAGLVFVSAVGQSATIDALRAGDAPRRTVCRVPLITDWLALVRFDGQGERRRTGGRTAGERRTSARSREDSTVNRVTSPSQRSM